MQSSGTILVVDNDEGVCAFLKIALEGHGFIVFVASSGSAALNLFREQRIDIVLMDIEMPDLGGPETLKMLQSIRADVSCFFTITRFNVGVKRRSVLRDYATSCRVALSNAPFSSLCVVGSLPADFQEPSRGGRGGVPPR